MRPAFGGRERWCVGLAALGAGLVAAVAAGCGDDGDVGPRWQDDPPGMWLAGDLHVHATGASNDTGGDSFPGDIAIKARARGLFFVVMTDHSNSTGSDVDTTDEDPELFNQGPEFVYWDEAAALSEDGVFLMVSGNEISPVADDLSPRGHVGCIPRTLEDFDTDSPFIDRPRSVVSGGDAVRQAIERGCFAILNHPYALTPWLTYDWTSFDYHGVEVWNGSGGGLDAYDMHGWDALRCDHLAGRRVTPIAASDNHRVHIDPPGDALNPPLGVPVTSVFATEPTWPAIIAGLEAGLVALHEGDSMVRLDLYDAGRRRAEDASARHVRLRGALDRHASSGATLRLTRATACDDPRPDTSAFPTLTEVVLLEQQIAPGESFDVAVAIEGEAGVYSATLLTGTPRALGGARWSALSRVVTID